MEITIRGQNPRITANELRFATQWMAGLIMSSQLIKNLDITISYKKEKGLMGTTEIYDTENNLPRAFLIRLDPTETRTATLKTLAHELVHVKQFALGEMKDTKHPHISKWNKQTIDHEQINYRDLPREIEAFGREYGMYRRYANHLRENKIKFD